MTVSTHKMLADNGQVNTARMNQANSIGPGSKHFFDCTETVAPIVDAIGALELEGVDVTIGAGDDSGVNTRILGFPAAVEGDQAKPPLSSGTWTQPAAKDVVMVVCHKARIDGTTGDAHSGGYGSFYMGDSRNGILRVQPYQAIFGATGDSFHNGFSTPFYASNGIRNDGQIYIHATVKRGTISGGDAQLEHYSDGVLTGARDSSVMPSPLLAEWDNFTPDAVFKISHSAYTDSPQLCTNLTCVDGDVNGDACFTGGYQYPNMTDPVNDAGTRIVCDMGFDWWHLNDAGKREISASFKILPGNSFGSGEYADDYYGFYVGVFDSAPPIADIIAGINWMKTEWVAGNKVVYPGWVSFT